MHRSTKTGFPGAIVLCKNILLTDICPLVLRSLQLPHAFYTSMNLEIIAVLHYNNHDGVFHARALKSV